MDYKAVLLEDLERGFSKSDLEKLIGLPQNNLSGMLNGNREFSKKSKLKIEKWMASEKPHPLNVFFEKVSSPEIQTVPDKDLPEMKDRLLKSHLKKYKQYTDIPNKLINDVKSDTDNSEILAQIAATKAEKIPPERNTSLGKRVWENERDAKIRNLKSQLR